jgi:hypothetical protein
MQGLGGGVGVGVGQLSAGGGGVGGAGEPPRSPLSVREMAKGLMTGPLGLFRGAVSLSSLAGTCCLQLTVAQRPPALAELSLLPCSASRRAS